MSVPHGRGTTFFAAVLLSGCVTAPPMHPVRADGLPGTEQQLELDRTACLGEYAKSKAVAPSRNDIASVVMSGCMADRGWVLRPY